MEEAFAVSGTCPYGEAARSSSFFAIQPGLEERSWPIKGRTMFRVVSIEVAGAWVPADAGIRQTAG